MEGGEQFSKKDWVEHLRWEINDIQKSSTYNGQMLIAISTLFVGSLAALFSSTFFLMGIIGFAVSIAFYYVLFSSNYSLSHQRDDLTILLNKILLGEITEVGHIKKEFKKVSGDYVIPIKKIKRGFVPQCSNK